MNRRRGFTLVEILIVVGVFSVVSVIMGRLIAETFSSYKDQKGFLQVQHDARFAVEVLASELQDATVAPGTISPPVGTISFTTRQFCTGAVASADRSRTVSVTYALAAGTITRTVTSASPTCPANPSTIMRNVTQFAVERPPNGPIQITVEVTIAPKRFTARSGVTPRGQPTTKGSCYNPLGGPCP